MASRRMISSEIFRDDFFGELDNFGRLTWIGLIAVADDQGRIAYNANFIKADIFPYDDIPTEQLTTCLSNFHERGRVVIYSASGKSFIQIVNWWKYQTPTWAAPSRYPAPEGWTDRVKVHVKENKVKMYNWDKEGGFDDVYTRVHTSLCNDVSTAGTYTLKRDEMSRDEIAPTGALETPEELGFLPPALEERPHKTVEERKADTAAALASSLARQQAGAADLSWLEEFLRPLGQAFIDATDIVPLRAEYSGWRKFLREQWEMGVRPEVVPKAVKKLSEDGMTIKGPNSITATARDLMLKSNGSREETFAETIR